MITLAKTTLDSVRNGQAPQTQAAIDAVGSYIEDYQKPKGPLKLTLNPSSKVSMTEISKAKSPDEIVKALGLVVSYAGTRPGGSSGSAGGGSGATCTNGARFFVYHEDAWWSATARDASKSGKECIARIEGADDDIVVVFLLLAAPVAWSGNCGALKCRKTRSGG
jgi:hypothetical protein